MPPPFFGFAPDTDSGTVTRVRGTAPTMLTAHATSTGSSMSDLQMTTRSAGRALRTVNLPATTAHGQDLAMTVGDSADDGSPFAPGRYDVFLRAKVVGTDSCGQPATTHWVQTRAGILVVTG